MFSTQDHQKNRICPTATYLRCLRSRNHVNSARLNSICLRSLIKGKSAFPAPSVTIREGSIIPRNKQKKFGIKDHQFGVQQRRTAIWSQYPDVIKCTVKTKESNTTILNFVSKIISILTFFPYQWLKFYSSLTQSSTTNEILSCSATEKYFNFRIKGVWENKS